MDGVNIYVANNNDALLKQQQSCNFFGFLPFVVLEEFMKS